MAKGCDELAFHWLSFSKVNRVARTRKVFSHRVKAVASWIMFQSVKEYQRVFKRKREKQGDIMTKEEAREQIKEWQRGESTSFMCKLIDLISKADSNNRHRLKIAFPEIVEAWEEWFYGERV